MKTKFKTKTGEPTYYAFVCGHVESKITSSDHLFYTKIEVYKESDCNVWQIRGFKHYQNSSVCDRLFWDTIDTTMTDAIKQYKLRIKEYRG